MWPRAAAAALLLAAACVSEAPPAPSARPTGPPVVRSEVVVMHARQFDGELTGREPGSEEEFAAAAYILGHLQQAGYVVRLDGVPVGDLVRSTNVLASVPADEKRISALVAVTYDTPARTERGTRPANGTALGLFLELARAVNTAAGGATNVSFAALGAENSTREGGLLGSRRLAAVIQEEGTNPELVVVLGDVGPGPVLAVGSAGARLAGAAEDVMVPVEIGEPSPARPGGPTADVLRRVSDEWVLVAGPPDALGRVLLALLSEPN